MGDRTKVVAALIPLAIVDAIIPVPILGALLVYVTLAKPPWFSQLVQRIYAGG